MNKQVFMWSCVFVFLISDSVGGKKTNDFVQTFVLAKEGKVSAQHEIGKRWVNRDFSNGDFDMDSAEDLKWIMTCLEVTAENGNIEAHQELAYRYFWGIGVEKDERSAVEWILKGAQLGDVICQVQIAGYYKEGVGFAQNYQESVKWNMEAALRKNSHAQFEMGLHYLNGLGVVEDYVEAYAWMLVSLSTEYRGAGLLSSIFKRRRETKDGLSEQLSSNAKLFAQSRAKEIQILIARKQDLVQSESDKPLSSDVSPSGFGSGLLVKGGYVLTCWHVVEGAERVSISLDGKGHVASIVQKDAANDIAILKVSGVEVGASLNFSDEVKLGEKVFTLGYPHPDLQGSNVKFTTGSISSLTGINNSPRYFQISAPLQSGNSGGPLFDEYGNLVGIVAAKLDSLATLAMTGDLPQNVNYAIKADYLIPLLKTIEVLEVGNEKTKDVNMLDLIEQLRKSVVMLKVYSFE